MVPSDDEKPDPDSVDESADNDSPDDVPQEATSSDRDSPTRHSEGEIENTIDTELDFSYEEVENTMESELDLSNDEGNVDATMASELDFTNSDQGPTRIDDDPNSDGSDRNRGGNKASRHETRETRIQSDQTGAESQYTEATMGFELISDVSPAEHGGEDEPNVNVHFMETINTEDDVTQRSHLSGDESESHDSSKLRKIGRYEVISMLGEGAFGEVLRCRDPQLDRTVAVKIAKHTVTSDRRRVRRFIQEAKSAALLRHPNIIPVFEYGSAGKIQFIAYHFIEGVTLKHWLSKKNQRTLPEVMGVFAKIADALHYAHECGIVHRDIKPENILVDNENQPHIADFGCARMENLDVGQTNEGSLLGTPAYMSPEQASGKSNKADGRSDLWSVGVMLYEYLCGKRPFTGEFTVLIGKIQNTEPVPPNKIEKDLPRDLATICLKCLAKKPDDRFQNGGELSDELLRWINGEPIKSRPVPSWVRTWMWAKRNPTVALPTALFIVSLILGTILSGTFAYQASRRQAALVRNQVESLLSTDSASVPLVIDNLNTLGNDAHRSLDALVDGEDLSQRQQLRVKLALLSMDRDSDSERDQKLLQMKDGILSSDPRELTMIIPLLKGGSEDLVDQLWLVASNRAESSDRRMRASATLAKLDPESERWEEIDGDLISFLLREPASSMRVWSQPFSSRESAWRDPLEQLYFFAGDRERRRSAALIMGHLFEDEVDFLVRLALTGSAEQLRTLVPFLSSNREQVMRVVTADVEINEHQIEELDLPRVNRAILAHALGESSILESLWQDSSDPTERTESIHRVGPAGISPQSIRSWLDQHHETNPRIISAAMRSLVEATDPDLHTTERQSLTPLIIDIYKTNPDAGVHSHAAWVLQKWDLNGELSAARSEVTSQEPLPGMQWHEDPCGLCFIVVDVVESFQIGDPENELEGRAAPVYHTCKIPRRFGIAMTECTVGEFREFEEAILALAETELASIDPDASPDEFKAKERLVKRIQRNFRNRQLGEDPLLPVTNVTWQESAAFCNWLTDKQYDGRDLAYPSDSDSLDFQELSPAVLQNLGYRLPTAAEWEFACRAGAETPYYTGRASTWLGDYEWTIENSSESLHQVGTLGPNQLGVHDMLGNAAEWCDNLPDSISLGHATIVVDGTPVEPQPQMREIRGGSYRDEYGRIASFQRDEDLPEAGYPWRGFRVARTYKSD